MRERTPWTTGAAAALLLVCAGGCAPSLLTVKPLDYPAGARVRSVPLAVAVEVVEVEIDLEEVGGDREVKIGSPEMAEQQRRLRPALADLLARDLAERGPFGVAAHAPAVLRIRARQEGVKRPFRWPRCRLGLVAEVVDRSGAVVATAAGGSGEDECWFGVRGSDPRLDLGRLAGPASEALRRELAEQAATLLARFPPLPQGAPAGPAATGATPGAAPAPAAWLAGGAQRERRLAVLEFAGPLEPALLAAMSDEARAGALEAVRAHRVSVMTRESMQVVLAEMGKSALCVEGECEVETARNIGADLVVSGTVLRVDGVQVLTLKLHETARGTLLATASARGKSGLEALDAVRGAAAALFR